MISFPLTTNYMTVRAASSVTTITQPESQWLDLSGFADVIAFLEVREFALGGATTITCAYQTAPTKDEAFFQNMTTVVTLATGLTVTKMLKSSVTNPLSRFIRWQLGFTGSPGSAWDAVFRIWLACNAEGKLRQAVGMSPATQSRLMGPPPNGSSLGTPPSITNGQSTNINPPYLSTAQQILASAPSNSLPGATPSSFSSYRAGIKLPGDGLR